MKLKIKDGVDLKELKKFGLVYRTEKSVERYEWEETNQDGYYYVVVYCWNRHICANSNNKLFDLIKADMVEKEEE